MLNRVRKKIREEKTVVKTLISVALVIILSTLIYLTYDEYKKTIVGQQQQEMLGISKSIARSIEAFLNDVEDSVKVIALDKEFSQGISYVEKGIMTKTNNEKLKSYYEAEKKSIESVCFFDKNGNVLIQYPQNSAKIHGSVKADVDLVIENKKTYIGGTYLDESKKSFVLNIYEPVFEGTTFKGVISVGISLDIIYDRLINPIKIGKKGYAMVKDQYGTIIMHPVKEQIGMDVIETRKQMYPDLDFKELEDLINDQLTGKEGTAIYHSYWWGDMNLKKAKKLNSYAPVQLGEYFWVVALTMSYDEIQGPINKFSSKIIGIASLIVLIIFVFISALIKMKKNKEELEKETKSLKLLNETSEQLRKKEAELYHSNKLKMIGTLTGGIAHDINNLLTPILGYSELLLMRMPKDNEYYDEVEEIFKTSQKGKELVEQILLFSRKDSGIIKVEPIDMKEVTRETIKLLKAVLPKSVIIKETSKGDCGCINANFTQMHQVIFNLCTNAYQSIKNNTGIIEISLNRVNGVTEKNHNQLLLAEKDYIELVVKDTGCGMDEETKARIFDPFFTTKTIGEGTGLGLFVVQSIIDKYEGVINVESEIGKGSCFTIYLPLFNEKPNLQKEDALKNTLQCNKRILVVDDNEKIIKVLKKGLEHIGYEVVGETNGLRALSLFQLESNKIDLVITDYMMPTIKGSDIATGIKKIRETTGVILMTGYMDESEKAINNKDIDAYVSKPLEINNLSEVIKKVLSKFPPK